MSRARAHKCTHTRVFADASTPGNPEVTPGGSGRDLSVEAAAAAAADGFIDWHCRRKAGWEERGGLCETSAEALYPVSASRRSRPGFHGHG